MSIRINRISTLATIQDGGRKGYQTQGVPIGGAMDNEALAFANILVGNDQRTACIEIASGKLEITVELACVIALTGFGLKAVCAGHEVPYNRRVHVKQGMVLSFIPSHEGCWTYLAVAGGFNIPEVLGSRSTYLPAGFGGVEGRALKAKDKVKFMVYSKSQNTDIQLFKSENWGLLHRPVDSPIRVFAGPDWSRLMDNSKIIFLNSPFQVSGDSNRMGYRLTGQILHSNLTTELVSSPVVRGTIQLTNKGTLIVLMADAQTIGGYPRVGQVIAVDLPRLAQKRPGELIQFEMISYEESCALFLRREQERRQTQVSVSLKLKA